MADKSLEHFRVEYEKIHRALRKSVDNERRLIKKCKELNSEIVSNASKVQTAVRLSQEDQVTISNLKKEIEKAWKMVQESHDKEQAARETTQLLRAEVQKLTTLVEEGEALCLRQENEVNDLMTNKEDLINETEGMTKEVTSGIMIVFLLLSSHH
jgi:flagellar biosynthesis chaperone FliJ